MKHYIFCILFVIISIQYTSAQEKKDSTAIISHRKVVLKAKNTGKKIILRWAPDSPGTWHMSNTKGYMVERMAYKKEDDFFQKEYQLLTKDTLKPWPLNKWESIANEASGDTYAAIAAQAIYGKRNFSDPKSTTNFMQKASELNNLYGFAMLAAEFSRNAALASALRFEDTDIDSDKEYIYRVYSNASDTYYKIDTAYVQVSGSEITKIPTPIIEKAIEGEQTITLKWDRALTKNFSAWYVEKSLDNGKTFKRLTKDPYIHSIKNKDVNRSIVYVDSINQLYKKYQYRIIGINTFAELSKPSPVVTVMGRDRTPPPTPYQVKAEQVAENSLKITWEAEIVPDLKGFYITKSLNIGSKEELITKELLSKTTRSFTDKYYDQLQNNWYQIYAIDTAGNAIVSYPIFGSVRDDFAPNTPKNIQGEIDTLGIVKLNWNLGKEKDLFGYHVYMANAKEHVFTRLTPKPIRDTVFTDTITLKVLTEDIYYRIKAVDIRGNVSEFSDILPLKKPDIVPPTAPVFNDYKVLKNGIRIAWAASVSKDIETHYLYRKEKEATTWQLIYRTNKQDKLDSYLDTITEAGKTYNYKLVAEDDDGLQTEGVYIITLTAIDFSKPTSVKNINLSTNKAQKQIVLKWIYPKKGTFTFILYRAINGGGFTIIKTLKSSQTQYQDKQIIPNTTYEYAIQVHYPNGKKSKFSPIKKITY